MNSYFPSVRLIDSLRNPVAKETSHKIKTHVRNKSTNIDLFNSSKPSKEQIYPANSRAKSKEQNIQKGHLVLPSKRNDMAELDVPQSPVSNNSKINVINSYNPKGTSYGEFNKNVLSKKPVAGKIQAFSVTNNKILINSSNNNVNVSQSQGLNKSNNNVSWEMTSNINGNRANNLSPLIQSKGNSNQESKDSKETTTTYTNFKISPNPQKGLEAVESMEELHFFYVNLAKQNKILAMKFEGNSGYKLKSEDDGLYDF